MKEKSEFQKKMEEMKKLIEDGKIFFPPVSHFQHIDQEMLDVESAFSYVCTAMQFAAIRELAWNFAMSRRASNRSTMMYLYDKAYLGFSMGMDFEQVIEFIKTEIDGLKLQDRIDLITGY